MFDLLVVLHYSVIYFSQVIVGGTMDRDDWYENLER